MFHTRTSSARTPTRSRGRGFARGARGQPQTPKGLFSNNSWHCDCNPRLPAQHFRVKKQGPNTGRVFYTCQNQGDERCGFFLWEEDASVRMEAAVLANSTSEPPAASLTRNVEQGDTIPSETTPYATTAAVTPPPVSRKRKLPWASADDGDATPPTQGNPSIENDTASSDEEFYDWPATAQQEATEALSRAADQAEVDAEAEAGAAASSLPTTPRKPTTTLAPFTTPNKPHGLPTPGTTPLKPALLYPSPAAHAPTTPTPPTRMRDALAPPTPATEAEPLHTAVLSLLAPAQLHTELKTELQTLLTRHERQAQGYARGRDVARRAVAEREARIVALESRVRELEGQLEGAQCVDEMVEDEKQRETANGTAQERAKQSVGATGKRSNADKKRTGWDWTAFS